jgi:hypothetical protein
MPGSPLSGRRSTSMGDCSGSGHPDFAGSKSCRLNGASRSQNPRISLLKMALRYDRLMKRYYTIIVTVFAIANFLFAACGGWLLYETVRNYYHATTGSSNPVVDSHGFAVTFFTLTWINGIFLCLLILAAVLLLRFRLSGITFCMTVFAAEIGYFMATTLLSTSGISWFRDVGGAEGIGNMGLAPQILTGYPLIGLISLFLVRRNLRRKPEAKSSGVVPHSA